MSKPPKSPAEFVEANRQLQAMADPVTRGLIDAMKGQLLMVLIERLGGVVTIPASEIDNTGGLLLHMEVVGSAFVFRIGRKN